MEIEMELGFLFRVETERVMIEGGKRQELVETGEEHMGGGVYSLSSK